MEEALDAVPRRVRSTIEPSPLLADRMRMNHGLHAQLLYARPDRVRVVARVGEDLGASGVFAEDGFCDRGFVLLAGRDFDVERPPLRVDECVDLRGEATSRATQSIALDPPFPPAASWWARTIDESMMTPSSSTRS